VLVFGGGVIPDAHIAQLERDGIARVFTPGAPLGDIVTWLRDALAARRDEPTDSL
jgi:methylmalonyl-CoA mutase C-terminal domain/subunit